MDNDLINRSALLIALEYDHLKCEIVQPRSTFGIILSAPAVNAVEIVRCEKCVFKQAPEEYGDLMCGMLKVPMKNNGFCSYGERMADNA